MGAAAAVTRLFQAMAGADHGGAESFFTRLALALERDGQDQLVAIRPQPERAAQLRAGGVAVTELPFGGWLDWVTAPRLKRLVRDWQPDIVLTWMNRATSLMPDGSFVRAARLGGYYDLKYYSGCEHLIGNTQDIVAYLVKQGWPAERAHYLPNFVSDAPSPKPARAGFDTPEDAPLLLALGRLHPVKGFDVLLRALARVPEAYLWLAGDGRERRALDRLAASLGLGRRLRFLGWTEDSAALLAACDILVCPSRQEPLGNVVLEAWAQRTPVIATAAAGPRQLIRHGETGILVPVDDVEALAGAITDLIAAPERRAALAEAGYAAFAAGHSERVVVAAYRDFFERVAR
jgi:glycosyltransferase involved in cell wall biosynthesis